MGRNTGRETKEKPNEEIPEEGMEVDTFEEGEGVRQNSSFTTRIYEFIEKSKIDEVPTFTLHKYDDPRGGEGKAFIDRYDSDPPDEHTIGMKHGSGRYILIMSIPRSKITRWYRFKIHPRYDQLRDEAFQQSVLPTARSTGGGSPVVVHQGGGLLESLTLLERLVGVLSPLFARRDDPDFNKLLFENFKSTNQVLQQAQIENIKTARTLISSTAEEENVEDMQAEPEKPSIVEQITPLINQWLPILLGGGQKAQAVSTLAHATPQFMQIVKNRKDFRTILAYLDKTHGKEKTDTILKNLKLRR